MYDSEAESQPGQGDRAWATRTGMGTASYVLVGTSRSMAEAFGSAPHGVGCAMGRHQATRHGRSIAEPRPLDDLLYRPDFAKGDDLDPAQGAERRAAPS